MNREWYDHGLWAPDEYDGRAYELGDEDASESDADLPKSIRQGDITYVLQGGRYVPAPGIPVPTEQSKRPRIKAIPGTRVGVDADGLYYILDAVGGGVTEVDPTTGEVPRDLGSGSLQWREMTPEEYVRAEAAGIFDPDFGKTGGSGGGIRVEVIGGNAMTHLLVCFTAHQVHRG